MAVREKRSISRSLFVPGSRKFWGLKTDQARLLYLAMLLSADDEGRLEGSVSDLLAIMPRCVLPDDEPIESTASGLDSNRVRWTSSQMVKYRENLKSSGLVSRYKVGEHQYVQITDFDEHQSWHGLSRDPSQIPGADGTVSVSTASTASGGIEQAQQESAPAASAPKNGRTTPGRIERKALFKDKTNSRLGKPAGGTAIVEPFSEGVKGKNSSVSNANETWKEMRSKYRRKVGKSLGAWKPKGGQLIGLLEKYGYDMVMRGFELWLEDSTKAWLRTVGYPFAMFIAQATDHIEEAEEERDNPGVDEEDKPDDDPTHVSEEGRKLLERARSQPKENQ